LFLAAHFSKRNTKFGDGGKNWNRKARAGKNSFPPTPSLFARLLGLRPQNFSADGRRDIELREMKRPF